MSNPCGGVDFQVRKAIHDLTPEQAFKLWDKYEKIAMHFNDMLIKWRLQVVSGLATLGTLAGVIAHAVPATDWRGLAPFVCTGLLVVWCAVAALDLFYYSNLLQGAVIAIIELEASRPELRCSTRIEQANSRRFAARGAGPFYGIVAAGLLGFLLWCACAPRATQALIIPDGCACCSE